MGREVGAGGGGGEGGEGWKNRQAGVRTMRDDYRDRSHLSGGVGGGGCCFCQLEECP